MLELMDWWIFHIGSSPSERKWDWGINKTKKKEASPYLHSHGSIGHLGGNPLSWTLATPHAFGSHLPFQFYSRAPLNQARTVPVCGTTMFVMTED